jgi:hypothetical protein
MATSMAQENRIELNYMEHLNGFTRFKRGQKITPHEISIYIALCEKWNAARTGGKFLRELNCYAQDIGINANASAKTVGKAMLRLQSMNLISDYTPYNGAGQGIRFCIKPLDKYKDIESPESTLPPVGKYASKRTKKKEETPNEENEKDNESNVENVTEEVSEEVKKTIMQQFGGYDNLPQTEANTDIFQEHEINSFAQDLLDGFKEIIKQTRELVKNFAIYEGLSIYPDSTDKNGVYFEFKDKVGLKCCEKIVRKLIEQHKTGLSHVETNRKHGEMLIIIGGKLKLWMQVIADNMQVGVIKKDALKFKKYLSKFNPQAMSQWDDIWKIYNPPYYKSSAK